MAGLATTEPHQGHRSLCPSRCTVSAPAPPPAPPVVPGGQRQRYLSTKSRHLPPWRQGWLRHSSTWLSQRVPVYPGAQAQEKLAMPSTQRPWWHGSGEQSSTLRSHRVPSKPGRGEPEDQAPPTCQGPAGSRGSGPILAHLYLTPCPANQQEVGSIQAPPLTPSSDRLQDTPLAKTLPHINPIPRCTLPPVLTLPALFRLTLRSGLEMGTHGKCLGIEEFGGDTPPLPFSTKYLPDPLAPTLALPLLRSIIGSTPWLCHWLY